MLIKELMGHSDIRTTMRYAHLTPLATREAIKALSSNIGDIVETISETVAKKVIDFPLVGSKISLKT